MTRILPAQLGLYIKWIKGRWNFIVSVKFCNFGLTLTLKLVPFESIVQKIHKEDNVMIKEILLITHFL